MTTESSTTFVSDTAQLVTAIRADKNGGTIELLPGTYTGFDLYDVNPTSKITITSAESSSQAVLTGLQLSDSSNFTFQNLVMSTADTAPGTNPAAVTPFKFDTTSNLAFNNVDVTGSSSVNPAENVNGFSIETSSGISITNSTFQYLNNALGVVNSKNVLVQSDLFQNEYNDGIDAAAVTNITITGSTWKNMIAADTTAHADAIQFFTTDTTVASSGITITNNVITRGTGGAGLQGIFMTDPSGVLPYSNVTISGNAMTGIAYDAIYLENLGSGKVTGNTVTAYSDQQSWIQIDHSKNLTVSGNKAEKFGFNDDSGLSMSDNTVTSAVPTPTSSGSAPSSSASMSALLAQSAASLASHSSAATSAVSPVTATSSPSVLALPK
jgi:Right handed beta helix region